MNDDVYTSGIHSFFFFPILLPFGLNFPPRGKDNQKLVVT